MRRRREEEGIQLRKQKREQQLIKRRNVNVANEEDVDSAIQVTYVFNVNFGFFSKNSCLEFSFWVSKLSFFFRRVICNLVHTPSLTWKL